MSKAATLCLVLVLLCVVLPGSAEGLEAMTITVSGTVTGPSGAVAGLLVSVGSDLEGFEVSTDAAGFYSATMQTTGHVNFNLHPDPALRLAWLNYTLDDITTDFTEDILLEEGNRFDLGLTAGGALVSNPHQIELQPVSGLRFESQWHSLDWNPGTHRYFAVLPPDIYWVTLHTAPAGTFPSSQGFDLGSGDLVADLPFGETYSHPIPYEPPDASKIRFGAVDGLGEAVVTGGQDSVLPLAHVLLVNLKSGHQAYTVSEPDGSFESRI